MSEVDVFISHASTDLQLAQDVCRSLEAAEIHCWIAPRDIPPGEEWPQEIVRGIEKSRVLLLLLTAAANGSRFVQREVQEAGSIDRRIFVAQFDNVKPAEAIQFFVKHVHWYNAIGRLSAEFMPELVDKIKAQLRPFRPPHGGSHQFATEQATRVPDPTRASGVNESGTRARVKRKVALIYRRHVEPDDQVVRLLESRLGEAGHTVFVDHRVTVGLGWAAKIEQEVKTADAVIPLISAGSVQSEMLSYEVQMAHQAAQGNEGRPHLLPVRIRLKDRLPQELSAILDPIQYLDWNGPEDNDRLTVELLAAIQDPPKPTRISLEVDVGAVPLDSKYYIERPADRLFAEAIERRDSIVLVKGARQMGKTSLLARGLKKARAERLGVVWTDFQRFTKAGLASLEQFYFTISEALADGLKIDADPRAEWRPHSSPNANFERFLKREIFGKVNGHLLWAMDEVDRLFTCPFGNEVFGLFRTWHNARANDPAAPWGRLTLVIAYSTEVQLFITNIDQSPFNVGTRVEMEDFSREQAAELNRRHGSPLKSESELQQTYALIGGQPHLNRRAINDILGRGLTADTFAALADQDKGPFGDHLRRILVLLAASENLADDVRELLRNRPVRTVDAFFRLRAAGIVSGTCRDDAQFRCRIYESYLRRHLI